MVLMLHTGTLMGEDECGATFVSQAESRIHAHPDEMTPHVPCKKQGEGYPTYVVEDSLKT